MSEYPEVRLTVNNCGIGGTGSLSGLMRCEKEIIDVQCDLVFLEYAVNDCYGEAEKRQREREGLIRKVLKRGCDIILVYTFRRDMHRKMVSGGVPDVIAEFEELAEHYELSSVWSGKYAIKQLKKGRISWEGWLPVSGDNIHPGYAGSQIYAEPVLDLLKETLTKTKTDLSFQKTLPPPLNELNYETIAEIPMQEWSVQAPWCIQRELKSPWYNKVVYTCADGAQLSFAFSGRALMVQLNFGKRCGVFYYKIDDRPWKKMPVDRAYWVPDKDWCTPVLLESDLAQGKHTFTMKTVFQDEPDCKGSECKIYTFMTVR